MPGGEISCIAWEGPHAATLLFVHANGFNAQTYLGLLAPLAGSLDVFACDLRGHGFSTLPAASGSAKGWKIFTEDLVGLLGALGREPFVLAGHSLGATTSLMTAVLAPERVRALVLVEPVLLPPTGEAAAPPPNLLAERAAVRRAVFASTFAAFEAYRGRSIFASWPDAVLKNYLEGGLVENDDGTWRLACAPAWEAEIFRGAPRGLAHIAENVACPVTVLQGAVGSATSDQQLAELLRAKPDARIVRVRDASHFLPMENPQPVRDEIRRIADVA